MPTLTDYITALALFYLFCRGWNKGLLRTVLAPLALAAGCLVAYTYYQQHHNLVNALAICMLAPFAFIVLATGIIHLWHKAVNSDIPPSFWSRAAASALNVVWGGAYLAILILLIGLTPVRFGGFAKVQDNVIASRTFVYLKAKLDEKIGDRGYDLSRITKVLSNPEKLRAFQETEEYRALQDDEELQALFTDEEIAEMILNRDYPGLLAHPKMQAIFQNEELLKKMFALNKRIAEEGAETPIEDGPEESPEGDPH